MKVKVKDIATAAGVSPSAVSLVLNNRPCRLSEHTKEHIRRVAGEMRFQQEQGLDFHRFGQAKTIGLVIPDTNNPFFQILSEAISKTLFAEGYMVFQCLVGEDLNCCYQALESLTGKNVDGIIVVPPCTKSKDVKLIKMLKALQESGIPMMLADRAVYSIFCDFVTSDNKYGGRLATEHLLKLGHTRIGCILGNQEVYTGRKRLEGYKQALASYEIAYDEDLVWYGAFNEETGEAGAKSLLLKGVTGIFAGNDMIAQGIYQYARSVKLQIPQELSVVGFDNTPVCQWMTPPLTSVGQNVAQLAEQITEVILGKAQGTHAEENPRNYYFTPTLIMRYSTAEL